MAGNEVSHFSELALMGPLFVSTTFANLPFFPDLEFVVLIHKHRVAHAA